MELVAADVDGDDVAGATTQQHVGKAAGGGADVEAGATGWRNSSRVQGVGEFYAAARNIGMCRKGIEGGCAVNGFGRLFHGPSIRMDQTGHDGRLGLGAAVEQAALDQEEIGSKA